MEQVLLTIVFDLLTQLIHIASPGDIIVECCQGPPSGFALRHSP